MTDKLRRVVAGLLSTIDFTPADFHPERMLEHADQVIAVMRAWNDPSEYDDIDEDMARGDIAADAAEDAAIERMREHNL